MKKSLKVMLAVAVSAAMLAGCAAKESPSPEPDPTPPEVGQQQDSTPTPEPEVVGPQYPFSGNPTIEILEVKRPTFDEKNFIEQKIGQALGANLIFTQVPEANFRDQYGIILASKKLPDVVNFPALPDINDWISQGAVIALDDLIPVYAPDAEASWTDDDRMRITSATDGKIYSIPALSDLKESFSVGIREDWLKKVGKEVPKTLDEYRDVLVAFRDGDPNGNNQKDEIPYGGWLRVFENAFGIQSSTINTPWQINNGKYVHRAEHARYIEWAEYMRGIYADGLMDKEYYTRNKDMTQVDDLVFADLLGTWENYAAGLRTYTESLREKNPEAKTVSIAPIIGPYGDQQIMGRARIMSVGAVTATSKQPEIALQYLNWYFTDAGITLTNYGVEGEQFDYVNGKAQLRPEFSTFEASRKIGINKTVGPVVMTPEYYVQCMLGGETLENATETFKLFYDGLFNNTQYIYTPPAQFAVASILEKGAEINQRLEDAEIQYIIGNTTLDQLKAEIQACKADGLDQMTKEVNEIYEVVGK